MPFTVCIFQDKINICIVYHGEELNRGKKAGKEDWEEGSKGWEEGSNLK